MLELVIFFYNLQVEHMGAIALTESPIKLYSLQNIKAIVSSKKSKKNACFQNSENFLA